jgi:hypothetical protein
MTQEQINQLMEEIQNPLAKLRELSNQAFQQAKED